MSRLLRHAAASASGLRSILSATLGAAGFGVRDDHERRRPALQRRPADTDHRLERLEL